METGGYIVHNNKMSDQRMIKRGVIQGENNSQILFSLFIINIARYIEKCTMAMFADDVQIYYEFNISEIENGIQIINNELKNIEQFCIEYGIEINPAKTKAIIISSKRFDDFKKYTIEIGQAI